MRKVIAVAMHKPAPMPDDPMYLPVQAGAALHPGFGIQRDDAGESISRRNPFYSELTVHYWLWRNMDADVYGLCHYRRYFARRLLGRPMARLLTEAELNRLLAGADVIVPAPRLYLIETNYSHYAHAHRAADLELTREVVAERCPRFLPAFDRVMKRRWGRRFNMLIMRREPFQAYSAWLFGVLFEVEKRLSGQWPERTPGYLAERLMDVWLETERPRLRQLRVLHTQSQHWPRKIAAFIGRKVRGEST